MKLFAITAPGLEGVLASELKSLGLKIGASVAGGVEFRGELADMQRANLWSRVANRIVVRMEEFHASSFHELERRAKKVAWDRFVSRGSSFQFRVTCRKSRLYHSDAVAERLANAVIRSTGASMARDQDEEDESSEGQLFIVRIVDDICSISADSSGDLLHRRGYRQAVAKAPLRETLAAAMLIGSGWDMKSPLVDPMCGSGTIPIEGAMMARRMAPGVGRDFAFERWAEHDASGWKSMVDDARAAQSPSAAGPILASDRDAGAIAAARANAERAGVANDIELRETAISNVEFPATPGWIVSNPPYGLRVGESAALRNLYARLGTILRDSARGYRLALLSADRSLESQTGIPLKEVFRTSNGGIPVRLVIGGGVREGAASKSRPQF